MRKRQPVVIFMVLLAGACAVGPNYVKPGTTVPPAWKEAAPPPGSWKPAEPRDETSRGKWWEIFGDPALNELEEQVSVSNQTLAQAEAAFRGARAVARGARADLFPVVTTSPSVSRGLRATAGAAPSTATTYDLPLNLTWEADVFGAIRRNLESGVSAAQASAADLEAVRLAVRADLAINYFSLRGQDEEKHLLDSTVAGFETSLKLTRNRHDQGVVSGVDVAQAETLLETTRVQATDLRIERAQLEHAIAVLLGKAPSDFAIPVVAAPVAPPPEIPVDLPSELLERRPDVAGAERRVAAANAQVGVATAGFFPRLVLAASGGYASATLASFFAVPNRFWSLGATLLETLFDAGKRRAQRDQAVASYDAVVAVYRERVLTAFLEVEDELAALSILSEEAAQRANAVSAAERLLTLAKNRYDGGITTYLEVVTAQSAALGNEQAAVALATRRMTASVSLIKALGGGWRASELPSPGTVLSREGTDRGKAPASSPAN